MMLSHEYSEEFIENWYYGKKPLGILYGGYTHDFILQKLTNVFSGTQEEMVKKLGTDKRLFYENIIEHKTENYVETQKITIPYVENVGISNVKITGEWERVILHIDCSPIDRIYKITGMNTFDCVSGGCCLPTLKNHNIIFEVEGTNYSFEYDLVSVNTERFNGNDKPSDETSLFIRQCQNLPNINLDVGVNKIKVGRFNHPMERFMLLSKEPITTPIFLPANEGLTNYKINFTQISPLKWEIHFGEKNVLNFSRLDSPIIYVVNSNPNNKLHIYGISQGILRGGLGMMGFAWGNFLEE